MTQGSREAGSGRRSAYSAQAPDTSLESVVDGVERALQSVRSHLGMDVAFVSEFVGDRRIFRHVDAALRDGPIKAGDHDSIDEGYCRKVIEGHLPELIPDTAAVPAAAAIPATRILPIGSHISVPLRLADGRIYGTFCCFSFTADPTLNERDLRTMKVFADLVAQQIDIDLRNARRRAERVERIEGVLRSGQPSIVFQPIYRLSDMSIIGAESLSRFRIEPSRPPDEWFAEAGETGLKTALELTAIRNALAGFGSVWEKQSQLYLSFNSSAQSIVEGSLLELLADVPLDKVVLELTEHDHVEGYDDLLRVLAPLRARGMQVAIDDAGSGYASMRHILNVSPDYIKLDSSLTRSIDTDRTRRALASALLEFGRQTDCKIVAEGVESAGEMETLRDLGVHSAQGFHLSRPLPVEAFCGLLG